MKTKLITAATVAALAFTGTATAASPYQFTSRVGFERFIAKQFPSLARDAGVKGARVRSIGCAKNGVRASCAVVASSPAEGTRSYAVSVACRDTRGNDCAVTFHDWPR